MKPLQLFWRRGFIYSEKTISRRYIRARPALGISIDFEVPLGAHILSFSGYCTHTHFEQGYEFSVFWLPIMRIQWFDLDRAQIGVIYPIKPIVNLLKNRTLPGLPYPNEWMPARKCSKTP